MNEYKMSLYRRSKKCANPEKRGTSLHKILRASIEGTVDASTTEKYTKRKRESERMCECVRVTVKFKLEPFLPNISLILEASP